MMLLRGKRHLRGRALKGFAVCLERMQAAGFDVAIPEDVDRIDDRDHLVLMELSKLWFSPRCAWATCVFYWESDDGLESIDFICDVPLHVVEALPIVECSFSYQEDLN